MPEREHRSVHWYLVIHSVPFGHQHAINSSTTTHAGGGGEILERIIKFGQLVHCFIADKSFSDKDDFVWVVD